MNTKFLSLFISLICSQGLYGMDQAQENHVQQCETNGTYNFLDMLHTNLKVDQIEPIYGNKNSANAFFWLLSKLNCKKVDDTLYLDFNEVADTFDANKELFTQLSQETSNQQ